MHSSIIGFGIPERARPINCDSPGMPDFGQAGLWLRILYLSTTGMLEMTFSFASAMVLGSQPAERGNSLDTRFLVREE
jgi:hypothetical protein